jgi:exodeoxyribonuclease-3
MNICFPKWESLKERLDHKMDFYDTFFDYANSLKAKGKKLVICGDVNTAHKEIDLARPKENETISGFLPEERAWMGKFLAAGYIDTFRMFNSKAGNYS